MQSKSILIRLFAFVVTGLIAYAAMFAVRTRVNDDKGGRMSEWMV